MPLRRHRKHTKAHTTHKDDVRHGCLADRWGEEGFWHPGKLDPDERTTEHGVNSPETLRILANYEGANTDINPNVWAIVE